MGEGVAILAVNVKLKFGNQQLEKEINESDVSAVFDLNVQKGETVIEAWLVDSDGNEQNAYYTYVKKIKFD